MDAITVERAKEGLTTGEFKIIPNSQPKKSDVWATFGVVVNSLTLQEVGFVACQKCQHVLKMKQGNGTSTMMRHKNKCDGVPTPTQARRTPPTPHAKADFKTACVQYCVKDMRPFSSLAGEGMKCILQKAIDIGAAHAVSGGGTVNVEDLIPNPNHLPDDVRAEARACREELTPKIKEAISRRGCTVTSDLWTDNYRKFHYMALTAHFINDDWEIESHPLVTTRFDKEETGANIKRFMAETMEKEFDISEEGLEKLVFITDNGGNIRKALEDFKRLYCITHAFNICVRGALSLKYGDLIERSISSNTKANSLVETCDKVVRFVKNEVRSSNPGETKVKKQLHASKKHLNSYTKMLQSLKNNLQEVREILEKRGQVSMLNDLEVEAMEEIIHFLHPLDFDGSRESSSTVTLSKWKSSLQKEYAANDEDSEMMSELKSTVRKELKIMEMLDQVEQCKGLAALLNRTGLNAKLSKSVKQEMEVRWNSLLFLLKSIDDVWDEIPPILRQFSDITKIAGIRRDVIQLLIFFLSPFDEETQKLQGEKYPTSPLAMLSFFKLLKHCEVPVTAQNANLPKPKNPGEESSDCQPLMEPEPEPENPAFGLLRRNASILLNEKVQIDMVHKVATFLSPKFRQLAMLPESSRNEVLAFVRNEIATGTAEQDAGAGDIQEGPTRPKKSKLDSGYDEYACAPTISANSEDEVDRYFRKSGNENMCRQKICCSGGQLREPFFLNSEILPGISLRSLPQVQLAREFSAKRATSLTNAGVGFLPRL